MRSQASLWRRQLCGHVLDDAGHLWEPRDGRWRHRGERCDEWRGRNFAPALPRHLAPPRAGGMGASRARLLRSQYDFTHSSAPGVVRRAIIAAVCFFLLVSLLFLLLIRIIPARDYEETERCVAANARRTPCLLIPSHSVGGSGGRRSC